MCEGDIERQPRVSVYIYNVSDEERALIDQKVRDALVESHLGMKFEAINPDDSPITGIRGEMSPTGRAIFDAFMEGCVDPEAVILPTDEPK